MSEAARKIETRLNDLIEPEAAQLWAETRNYSWSEITAFSQAVSLRRIADAVAAICDDNRREQAK